MPRPTHYLVFLALLFTACTVSNRAGNQQVREDRPQSAHPTFIISTHHARLTSPQRRGLQQWWDTTEASYSAALWQDLRSTGHYQFRLLAVHGSLAYERRTQRLLNDLYRQLSHITAIPVDDHLHIEWHDPTYTASATHQQIGLVFHADTARARLDATRPQ